MRNFSHENELCIKFHFHANQSHFYENVFALRLASETEAQGNSKMCLFDPGDGNLHQAISGRLCLISLLHHCYFLFLGLWNKLDHDYITKSFISNL